jgi:hypothetical protein
MTGDALPEVTLRGASTDPELNTMFRIAKSFMDDSDDRKRGVGNCVLYTVGNDADRYMYYAYWTLGGKVVVAKNG